MIIVDELGAESVIIFCLFSKSLGTLVRSLCEF